jgi:type I protein arginine methyltransferase
MATFENSAAKAGSGSHLTDASPIMKGDEAAQAADFANYFCAYADLYHQKQMLMDHNRMRSYHSAIVGNRSCFEGKVVLDVGCGTGVLSIWAAQAGAKKVFACEFTDMAKHARALVARNGLSDIVEVIQCSAEDLDLPCQVDIIVSEWMGYILLRESMLDSVIRARDKWMKPGGSMFPSHATMYFAAISHEDDRCTKSSDYQHSISEWSKFEGEMKKFYNIDMGALGPSYGHEQEQYYIYSSLWTELAIEHVIGQPTVMKRFDLNTCTLEDAEGVDTVPFDITVPFPCTVSGFAGWFTVNFNGSEETKVERRVTLSTGPEMGYTHWGQQVFYLKDAIQCQSNTKLHGTTELVRQEKNKRLYDLKMALQVDEETGIKVKYEIP